MLFYIYVKCLGFCKVKAYRFSLTAGYVTLCYELLKLHFHSEKHPLVKGDVMRSSFRVQVLYQIVWGDSTNGNNKHLQSDVIL